MNNNKIWGWVAGVVVIGIAAIVLFGASSDSTGDSKTNGTIVFAITDAAADIKNVSEIKMRVSKIEMHNETKGWINVSNEAQEFNLLKLKAEGKWQIAAQRQIAAGSYNQVRLMVSGATVVKTDGSTSSAKIPSSELKLNAQVKVNNGQTATVGVDVLGDLSLHLTESGKYIFAPVVRVVSRSNASAAVATDNSVIISGGSVESNIDAGMDVNGEIKADFNIDSSVKLEIDSNNDINVGGIKVNAEGSGILDY